MNEKSIRRSQSSRHQDPPSAHASRDPVLNSISRTGRTHERRSSLRPIEGFIRVEVEDRGASCRLISSPVGIARRNPRPPLVPRSVVRRPLPLLPSSLFIRWHMRVVTAARKLRGYSYLRESADTSEFECKCGRGSSPPTTRRVARSGKLDKRKTTPIPCWTQLGGTIRL